MILMYHKIHPNSPSLWWVTVDNFYRQLLELQGKKVVYLDEYDPLDPDQVVITFDGVYQNILLFAAPLLKKFNYPFELFVTSDYIGKDNSFDSVDKRTGLPTNEPIARFATKQELLKLTALGGRLQWHTRSHPNLTHLDKPKELRKELSVPPFVKKLDPTGFTWFAYPHGEYNDAVVAVTRELFRGGLSVIQGDDSNPYILNRLTVTNESKFTTASVGVIIPCYNYGSYLVEAIESVLKQTRPADKILIINDGSNDNTEEIAQDYASKHSQISYIKNVKNKGIIATFNKAVKQIGTDYICLLGADNRFRTDYLEKTAQILDTNTEIGVAYTDFALFGPLASMMYQMMPADRKAGVKDDTYYLVKFPEFTKKSVAHLDEINFMHGSSLFRFKAYQQVGGYKKHANKAEDHSLFQSIVQKGWKAKRVAEPVLEYRQHSREQVNTKLNTYAELKFYKDKTRELQEELQAIYRSKFWLLFLFYKHPKQALRQHAPSIAKRIIRRGKSKGEILLSRAKGILQSSRR